MTGSEGSEERTLRRLERERKARREAEAIAERVTAELYATVEELERVNRQLESANQSIREFVAVASHDIRAPLAAVIGSAQILLRAEEGIGPEARTELVEMIERQGQRLLRIVDDLLTVSQLDLGVVEAHLEDISVRMELERVIADLSDGADQIEVRGPEDLWVCADRSHMQRMLINYLTNALKYGCHPIMAQVGDQGEFVVVRIRDEGAGVPEDFVDRLFTKFARAEGQLSAAEQGTGLGLSIVLGLARANGGDAWYEPNRPRGSSFCLKLPKAAHDTAC